jgi:hypothetical protein
LQARKKEEEEVLVLVVLGVFNTATEESRKLTVAEDGTAR